MDQVGLLLSQAPPIGADPISGIDPGPLFLIAASGLAVLTCGFALRRTLLAELKLPIEQRERARVLLPYAALFIASCIAIASVPQIFTISPVITYPIALAVGLFIAVNIWRQFILRALTLPPERFFRD